jgi:hypothetical protein
MRALLFIVLGLLCLALTSCPAGGDKGAAPSGGTAPSGGA